jgi:hypothetical protein
MYCISIKIPSGSRNFYTMLRSVKVERCMTAIEETFFFDGGLQVLFYSLFLQLRIQAFSLTLHPNV